MKTDIRTKFPAGKHYDVLSGPVKKTKKIICVS